VITNVVDSAGGKFDFHYDSRQLSSVSFGEWTVKFGYDGNNRLISKSVTNTSGIYASATNTWRFAYYTSGPSSNLLQQIIDPRGNTNITVAYDKYGRKTNEIDAIGRATRTEYGVPGKRQIRHTDPGTNYWIDTYDRKGHILVQEDPLHNRTSYNYDERGKAAVMNKGIKSGFGNLGTRDILHVVVSSDWYTTYTYTCSSTISGNVTREAR
jgi:YD repeat-containing protein